jgi:hypothetical protein
MAPARLDHADVVLGEVRQRALEEVGRRDEVGVENGHELARRLLQTSFQRPGLVAAAVHTVEIGDIQTPGGMPSNRELGDLLGLVGRVVQNLDLEQVARILNSAHRFNESIDDVHLVIERQLDGDGRQGLELTVRDRDLVLVLHVQVNQVVAVPPVHSKDDQNKEVGREDEGFSGRHWSRPVAVRTTPDYMFESSTVNETGWIAA